MNIKTNNATATASGAPNANDPHVIAARNVRDADKASNGALMAALRVGITSGRFQPAHLVAGGYPENSAKTLASEWNNGHAVAQLIGEKAALAILDATTKAAPTGTYRAALAALREVKGRAEAEGVTAKAPATATVARKLVKGAELAASKADEARRAKMAELRSKPRKGAQDPAKPAADMSPTAAWKGMGAQALALSHAIHAQIKAAGTLENRDGPCKRAAALSAELANLLADLTK